MEELKEPRKRKPLCDKLGCFNEPVVFVAVELRQGVGEVRLCRTCAEASVRELTQGLIQAERLLVGQR
jgi:hypothetical protein